MDNYYAKFILQYANIATLLYNLLWKKTKFDWITNCKTAFKQLKYALVHGPLLAMPNFDANFVVETNTSDVVVSAVLMQYYWPVAFISKYSTLQIITAILQIANS